MKLFEAIEAGRLFKGWTKKELAERAGIKYSWLVKQSVKGRETRRPSTEIVAQLETTLWMALHQGPIGDPDGWTAITQEGVLGFDADGKLFVEDKISNDQRLAYTAFETINISRAKLAEEYAKEFKPEAPINDIDEIDYRNIQVYSFQTAGKYDYQWKDNELTWDPEGGYDWTHAKEDERWLEYNPDITAFGLKVRDTRLAPHIYPGDFVLVSPHAEVLSDRFYLVRLMPENVATIILMSWAAAEAEMPLDTEKDSIQLMTLEPGMKRQIRKAGTYQIIGRIVKLKRNFY
jgi:hypothetical protein